MHIIKIRGKGNSGIPPILEFILNCIGIGFIIWAMKLFDYLYYNGFRFGVNILVLSHMWMKIFFLSLFIIVSAIPAWYFQYRYRQPKVSSPNPYRHQKVCYKLDKSEEENNSE
jgi:hypothetical protein